MNILEVMRAGPVIPILVIEEVAHAVPLARLANPRAASAAGVRKVTSSTRIPPATSALARGTAWANSSMTRTGMTGPARMTSRIFMGFPVPPASW